MYGARTSNDGREMIFLEYLEPTDDLHPFHRFTGDDDLFARFLAAAARFNAIRPSGEYAATLRRFDHEQIGLRVRAAADTLDEIWDRAAAGDLGEPMQQLCRTNRGRLSRLQTLPGELVERMARMELCLSHNDYYPDSVAVRHETGEMLLVDLESVGFAPRFWDVARWLGPPVEVDVRCRPRRELAQLYLAEYVRWGGEPVDVDRFLTDLRILAVASGLMMLPFSYHRALDGRVDWTEDRNEGRRTYRKQLHVELGRLLDEVS